MLKLLSLLFLPSVLFAQGTIGPLPAKQVVHGNTLPSVCSTGQIFFKDNATAGLNLYGCIANAWTASGSAASASCGTPDCTVTGTLTIGSTVVNGSVVGTLGTAAVRNTGTSGATIPLLNGGNIWSGAAVFQGDTRVWGSTGGDFELSADVLATGSNTPVTAPFFFSNNYWTGSASAEDAWIFRSQLATGTNSASTVILQKSFGSTGPAQFFLNYNNGSPYSADSGTNRSSPLFGIGGNYWNGSSSAADTWTFQNVLGAGTNPSSTLTLVHTGSSGTAGVNLPILTAPGVNTNTFISNGVQVNTNNVNATFYAPLIMQPGVPIIETLATPGSSSATCTAGAISWDASFIYICTATNTLKRATLNTF